MSTVLPIRSDYSTEGLIFKMYASIKHMLVIYKVDFPNPQFEIVSLFPMPYAFPNPQSATHNPQ
jgi:hypothetical protein